MIGWLLGSLSAMSASVTSMPVVVPPVPPSPPVVVTSMPRTFSNRPGITQTIAVQVRQDGRTLWAGEMSRSSKGTASFNQQLRESHACGVADNGRFATNESVSTGLTVSVTPDYRLLMSDSPEADSSVQVNVERTRPYGDGDPCADDRGSSTVRFTKTLRLDHGKPVTATGEGGLSVVLTLR